MPVTMPAGSSSAAPATRPGPRTPSARASFPRGRCVLVTPSTCSDVGTPDPNAKAGPLPRPIEPIHDVEGLGQLHGQRVTIQPARVMVRAIRNLEQRGCTEAVAGAELPVVEV